ncbi:hypothetical protein [Methylobacterium sp. J-076]|uniref:hypothetical protein n=1 Tax=Methylobacterium sp. J-076 TaxID=2836655 RepID=UPI001FB9D599|nr:hypothetical protein [Methylobacterium sp. J-076]MCJ2014408.1 hypothetical protein [Methylobacterium sp. J-076]
MRGETAVGGEMFVVAIIALCFSVPVAMLLCMVWLATTGHADLTLMPREAAILAASTAMISLALALMTRVRRR